MRTAPCAHPCVHGRRCARPSRRRLPSTEVPRHAGARQALMSAAPHGRPMGTEESCARMLMCARALMSAARASLELRSTDEGCAVRSLEELPSNG
eukprot:4834671-Alexandrium_andersonii.AAC.1